MRPPLALTSLLWLSSLLSACGEDVMPPAQAPRAATGAYLAGSAPDEALLAGLRPDSAARWLETAQILAARGDAPTRAAASSRLVALAQGITAPSFRERARPLLQQANRQANLTPTGEQLEAQVDAYRNEELLRVLAAMEPVGGRDVVAYCLALGENELAPLALRKAALAVLVRHADRRDELVRARSQAIWERVSALAAMKGGPVGRLDVGAASVSGGRVADASQVVAGMAGGFRRCYNKGLAEDAHMTGSVRITGKIGPGGEVSSATPSGGDGLTSTVIACVVARVAEARFAPPDGGEATIVIPLILTSM